VAVERLVGVGVVADGEVVVLPGQQPPVTAAVVELDAPSLEGVVGVRVCAALVVAQVVGGVARPVPIEVTQARLPSVRPRQPAQEVVERPVLHHHHDHVVDARLRRGWELSRRGIGLLFTVVLGVWVGGRRDPRAPERGCTEGGSGAGEQMTASDAHERDGIGAMGPDRPAKGGMRS